ncbi:hypothetical protein [Burkholderia vietnamiensis]|uniref:hypothetical protein n=1 Tax=Burkholderia vietnamiensis TaxID=60552 RepID=UPI001B96C713|nr:hypothetical protein [Burkholderia vietnamiensis]MBR8007126.1 hypothetical protein [Burkholderia vietnamiensis]MCA8447597.1 hypothetical protein [Burkholderia vietnamiensis]HDR8953348.1 hypothetical protein [Burkholderia vietnamiensis]
MLNAFVKDEAVGVIVSSPFTVAPVEMVGLVIVGDDERTTDPVPVAVDVPVPPLAIASGFWSVRLLNVGDGYVWASAISGAKSAERRNFFIILYEIETTPPSFQTTPEAEGR